jgi:hypothetical protein
MLVNTGAMFNNNLSNGTISNCVCLGTIDSFIASLILHGADVAEPTAAISMSEN